MINHYDYIHIIYHSALINIKSSLEKKIMIKQNRKNRKKNPIKVIIII